MIEAPIDDDTAQGGDVLPPPDAYDDPSQAPCGAEVGCKSDVIKPVEPFVPLPEHQAFCSLLDEIAERPYPDDEFDQIVVTAAWLQELRPITPAEIAGPLDVVITAVDTIVASQSLDLEDLATSNDLLTAAEAVGEFVDSSC